MKELPCLAFFEIPITYQLQECKIFMQKEGIFEIMYNTYLFIQKERRRPNGQYYQ